MVMSDLSGKIVLVTGAAGAIGSAIMRAIKQASGTAIRADLPAKPGIDTALDVSLEADWQRTTADIEHKYGRLDGLVNAAGVAVFTGLPNLSFTLIVTCVVKPTPTDGLPTCTVVFRELGTSCCTVTV